MKCFAPILALLLAAAGCVPSLHPIYVDKDIVFDEALLGTWEHIDEYDRKETWKFTKGEGSAYRFEQTDNKDRRGNFDAHLAKVGDTTFLSFRPVEEEDPNESSLHQYYRFPTYGFFAVDSLKPDLTIRSMNPGWLKEYLKSKPDAIAHEVVGKGAGERAILTADTAALQRFATEHLKTPDAYGKPYVLKRSK